jgi:UDP-N-acetylmuramoyl-tripeptide--D-alanyl-D-alanine ligase
MNEDQIERGLQNLQPLHGRLNIIKGISGTIIIDDTYNANPTSVVFALEELDRLSKKYAAKRKIAVLGDMLELGNYAVKGHQEVGKMAKKMVDLVLCVGELGKIIADQSGGKHFENKEKLGDYLVKEIKKDDIILLKASRKMKFETIALAIKKQ